MAERSAIEWTDSTFNPWMGCTKVSPGCDHCYAEARLDTRLHVVGWGAGQPRKRTSAANWRQPVKWNAEPFIECATCSWRGEKRAFFQLGPSGNKWTVCPSCAGSDWIPARRRVFCASLADVFDNEVPAEWRAALFALIANTPNLDWLLLTKRIGNVAKMIEAPGMQKCGLPPNVWLGATIVNQEEADRDIPKLLATPAAVRFLSMEPLLGPVDLAYVRARISAARSGITKAVCYHRGEPWIDWVIVGGESGHHARPMHPDWARSLRDQCAAAGVPFLFKQWGQWLPAKQDGNPGSTEWVINASDEPMRVGKKAAGRRLDGRTHDGFPVGAVVSKRRRAVADILRFLTPQQMAEEIVRLDAVNAGSAPNITMGRLPLGVNGLDT